MFTAMVVSLMLRAQEGLAPEDLRLEVVAVERAGERSVRIRARTARPDGAPWGRGLEIQAEARRVSYRLLFRDDLFIYPYDPEEGRPLPASGEINARGDVEIVVDCPAPGPHRVILTMNPLQQRDGGALRPLREMLRLRSFEGVPQLDLGELTVWAGEPGRALAELAADAAEYLEILGQAREVLDRARAAAEDPGTGDWNAASMELIAPLRAQLSRIEERERTSLLWASWNFLHQAYGDVEAAARSMPDRLEEERRGCGGGGSEGWGSESDIPGGKIDVEEGPTPVLAETYRGGLNLERMGRLLDLAPLYAAREALLWHARYAERGVGEIETARPDLVREWRDVGRDAGRTLDALRSSLERAARRDRDWFAEYGWNRYFASVAELFDNRNGTGLIQYADRERLAAEDPAVTAEPDDLRTVRETLEAAAREVERRNREPVVQFGPDEEQTEGGDR